MGLWEREADEALVAMVSEQPTDGWVIDMGPGTGLLLTLLAERFSHSRVRASDTSSAMLRACRQRLDARVPGWRGRVHLVREKALQLGVPDESSNLVFASFLLDILPASDIARALGEIRRVLRPGGAGYLAVLDARNDLRDASRGRVERRWLAVWRAVYAWLYQSPAVRALSRRLFRYTSHCHPIDLPPLVSQAEGLAVAQTRVSRIAILGLPALPVRLVKVVRS
jgi:ubiquinone/menaquinone biosynthesis C-methylase UbiE